ncbi:MAG: threonine synthase [Thermaerobacter sp.]|nr:threonine synthase [Thermaerobacter sp.]
MSGLIERYRQWLDLPDLAPVTLGEGHTPFILWDTWQGTRVWLKLEGCNPTGSFKDRGMTVAVSVARHAGARAVICASTGNTAASAAAYAGRAGLMAFVVVPKGQISVQKMLQAAAHGAQVLEVEGNFDVALDVVRHTADEHSEWLALVNSVNPWRLRGQETGAYEIVQALAGPPAALILPVGNAGNISAYFHGFRRVGRGIPRLFGIQALGADPMVQGAFIAKPQTVASAIRIGRPASAELAREAVAASDGFFTAVDDAAILAAQAQLAQGGVFVEPASAAAYAGALKLRAEQRLPAGDVALVLTGSGLKDTDTPLRWTSLNPVLTRPDSISATILNALQHA